MAKGRTFALAIGIYFIVKQLLNLLLGGFGFQNIFMLVLAVAYAAVLVLGLKYCNYIVAALAALTALYYLPGNLGGLLGSWLYLLEGILDIGAAAILIFQKDVRAYFNKTA